MQEEWEPTSRSESVKGEIKMLDQEQPPKIDSAEQEIYDLFWNSDDEKNKLRHAREAMGTAWDELMLSRYVRSRYRAFIDWRDQNYPASVDFPGK